jgi:hypothetical protein
MAPDPDDITVDPYKGFVLTRILPNQREVVLAQAEITEEQGDEIIRQIALEAGRQNRTNNPAWVLVVYGPIDPPSTFYTNGDRVWDSRVDL